MRIENDGYLEQPGSVCPEAKLEITKGAYQPGTDGRLTLTPPPLPPLPPRLFMIDNWYAVQTASDTIELFRYDVHKDNGTVEHYAHYCTVKWNHDYHCTSIWDLDWWFDLSSIDRDNFPWDPLRDIFEGRA